MIAGPAVVLIGPLLVAAVVAVLGRWGRPAAGGGAFLLAVLAAITAVMPLSAAPPAGPSALIGGGTWSPGGWALTLTAGARGAAVLLQLLLLTGCVAALADSAESRRLPGLILLLSPLTAALMLEPPTVRALALLVALCLAAATLAHRRPAASRFLAVWLAAGALLLVAAWVAQTRQLGLANPARLALALAVALTAAGFPFYGWATALTQHGVGVATAFVLGPMQLVALLLGGGLVAAAPAVLDSAEWLPVWQLSGGALLALAGLQAAQTWLPALLRRSAEPLRALSAPAVLTLALLVDLGVTLLRLAPGDEAATAWLIAQHATRFVALLVAGVGLRRLATPGAWGVWLTAYGALGLLGWPLTPGFAVRWQLLRWLWPQSPGAAAVLLLAVAGVTAVVVGWGWQAWRAAPPVRLRAALAADPLVTVAALLCLLPALALALVPAPLLAAAARLAALLTG